MVIVSGCNAEEYHFSLALQTLPYGITTMPGGS